MGLMLSMLLMLALIFVIYLSVLYLRKPETGPRLKRGLRILAVTCGGLLAVLATSGIWFEWARSTVVFYDDNGLVTSTSKIGGVCIGNCFDIGYDDSRIAVAVGTSVKPITDNPKVRDLRYAPKAWVKNPAFFFFMEKDCLLANRDGDNDATRCCLTARVEYYLYELNNARSKELAQFYNPRDPLQVEVLDKLVRGSLTEDLRPYGIAIEPLTSFEIH